MALSEGIQARLKALADLFAGELPERVQGIALAAGSARSGDDPEAYAELRMRSHKLAGSAATFGFVSITSASRQIEHVVDQALSAERPLNEAEKSELVRLTAELSSRIDSEATSDQDHADSQASEKVPGKGEADAKETKCVLACVSDETFVPLQEYLGMLGLAVDRRETPESMSSEAVEECVAVLVELPRGTSGVLAMAELQSAGVGDQRPFYVLAPEDSTKLRLQVTRVPHARYFPRPYPLESIADEIHERTESPQSGQNTIVVAGKLGPLVDRVSSAASEAGFTVSAVDTIESLMSEVVFEQPDTVVLVDDLKDARRAGASRALQQDPSLPRTSVVYVVGPSDAISVAEAFDEGVQQLVSAEAPESLRAYLDQRRQMASARANTLFRWVLLEVARAERLGRELSLVVLKIDQLPGLRDSKQGFAVHRAVRTLSSLLAGRLRHTDSLLQNRDLGFTAVLFDAGVKVAAGVSTEIVKTFEDRLSDTSLPFSLSVGIAGFPEFDGPLPLLDAAKTAVERARDNEGSHIEIEQKS